MQDGTGGTRVPLGRVNERPLEPRSYIMQGMERGSVQWSDREKEDERSPSGTRGLRGPRVDVEEFRGDGKSKGPVRERPDPFEV